MLLNQEIQFGRIFYIICILDQNMKNTGDVSTAECTKNITKKYVRLITPGVLPLCRKYNSSLFFLCR